MQAHVQMQMSLIGHAIVLLYLKARFDFLALLSQQGTQIVMHSSWTTTDGQVAGGTRVVGTAKVVPTKKRLRTKFMGDKQVWTTLYWPPFLLITVWLLGPILYVYWTQTPVGEIIKMFAEDRSGSDENETAPTVHTVC